MEPLSIVPSSEINHLEKNISDGQTSEPSSTTSNQDGNVLPAILSSNNNIPQVSSVVSAPFSNTANKNTEKALTNPITLLVKYVDVVSGKELYCTFMKVEQSISTIENLHETLLQRWSVKVEGNNESSNFVKKENIRKIQLKVADRFNQVTNVDLDNYFLKDYSLQESDMLLVHM